MGKAQEQLQCTENSIRACCRGLTAGDAAAAMSRNEPCRSALLFDGRQGLFCRLAVPRLEVMGFVWSHALACSAELSELTCQHQDAHQL